MMAVSRSHHHSIASYTDRLDLPHSVGPIINIPPPRLRNPLPKRSSEGLSGSAASEIKSVHRWSFSGSGFLPNFSGLGLVLRGWSIKNLRVEVVDALASVPASWHPGKLAFYPQCRICPD